jgi:hypothetical protein
LDFFPIAFLGFLPFLDVGSVIGCISSPSPESSPSSFASDGGCRLNASTRESAKMRKMKPSDDH